MSALVGEHRQDRRSIYTIYELVVVLKRTVRIFYVCTDEILYVHIVRTEMGTIARTVCLGALATYTPGQLYVLRHDGDTFGVDRAQIGVLE